MQVEYSNNCLPFKYTAAPQGCEARREKVKKGRERGGGGGMEKADLHETH